MAEKENLTSNNSRFDHMSTEELQEILKLDIRSSDSDDTNTDYIIQIMEVLARRKKENGYEPSTDVAAAWESFKSNYLPYADSGGSIYDWDDETDNDNIDNDNSSVVPLHSLDAGQPSENRIKPRRRVHPFRRVVIVAVSIIILGALLTTIAIGVSRWKSTGQWTRENFWFVTDVIPIEINEELKSLHDALSEYGITDRLAPTWIPADFVLTDFEIVELPTNITIVSYFMNGNKTLVVQIISFSDMADYYYEMSGEEDITIYRRNGIDHYIMMNEKRVSVKWSYENYEGYIIGDITVEDAEIIIHSIYER